MIAELYDALVSAGAPEEKARKSAETVAAYEARFVGVETKLNAIDAKMDIRFAKVDGDINLLKWMMGIIVVGVASLVLKAFLSLLMTAPVTRTETLPAEAVAAASGTSSSSEEAGVSAAESAAAAWALDRRAVW